MPLLDDVQRVWRDFVRYTGDGLPNPPVGHPLSSGGDPRSGKHNPSKGEVRDLLIDILQTMGDPSALQELLEMPGPIVTLSAVAGTGAAYTATAPANFVLKDGVFVLFTPHVDSTVATPTLSINGGGAFGIRPPVSASFAVGALKADIPVLLHFRSGGWRLAEQSGGKVGIAVLAGTGAAYTTTVSDVPLVAGQTILSVRPTATNTGPATVAINGAAPVPLLTEGFSALIANQLVSSAQYLGLYTGTNVQLIGVKSTTRPDPLSVAEQEKTAAEVQRQRTASLMPLVSGGAKNTPIQVNGAPITSWVASAGDAGRIITVANGTRWIDLRHIPQGRREGTDIHVSTGATAKLIAGSKVQTVVGPAYIRALRPTSGAYVFEAVQGSVTEDAGGLENVPARDLTLISAGQSLAAYCFQGGGLFGLQRVLADSSALYPSIWAVQGATGGSGLSADEGSSQYWWDTVANGPGPAALTWKAALDSIPVAQGKPDAIYWVHGQNTAYWMGTGQVTPANVKTWLTALFKWMRDQIDPMVRTPIILSPLGAYYAATTDKKAAAMRQVELDLIAGDPNIHLGPPYFDLPRGYKDVHLDEGGEVLQGYRLGVVLANVLYGQANPTGPKVTRIEELQSGKQYRLSIQLSVGGGGLVNDILPVGLTVLPAGADPLTANPAQIEYGFWGLNGSLWTYTLVLAETVPGGRVVWPYGVLNGIEAGRVIRDVNALPANGIGNYWPLQPVSSGAF